MSGARLTIGLFLIACSAPSWAGDAEDVWKGKHRVDVMALLGEPNKTKKSSGGSAVMIYKLIRLGDQAVPNPDFRVFELPGVGRVGRVVKNEDPAVSETIDLTPSGIDDEGRPSAGGIGTTQSTSRAWDSATGEWTGPEPPKKGPRSRGKVKLEFTLDSAEIVQGWTVSPK